VRSGTAAARARPAVDARKRKPLPPRERPGILRFENYKQLVLDGDGKPFEGWTPIIYISTEGARHFYRDARAVVRFALTAFGGVVLARFYVYAHPWCADRKGDGGPCPHPDPSPTGDLVREMEQIEGRQIPAQEPLLPENVARILSMAGSIEGKIETVRWTFRGKGRRRERVALERPYSKIAEIRPRVVAVGITR